MILESSAIDFMSTTGCQKTEEPVRTGGFFRWGEGWWPHLQQHLATIANQLQPAQANSRSLGLSA